MTVGGTPLNQGAITIWASQENTPPRAPPPVPAYTKSTLADNAVHLTDRRWAGCLLGGTRTLIFPGPYFPGVCWWEGDFRTGIDRAVRGPDRRAQANRRRPAWENAPPSFPERHRVS